MNISFIIPVLNGEKYIGNCLEHIIAEKEVFDDIIVVDNGSIDRTLEIVNNYSGVILISNPKATIGGLRNNGAAVSESDLLAFIDSDCLICSGWRKSVIDIMCNSSVGATGSVCDVPMQSTWVERAWISQRYLQQRPVSYIPSANLVIRKEVFRIAGGFSEHLITDEDTDICNKIRKLDYLIIEEPNARVIHLRNASTLEEFAVKEKWHATSLWENIYANGIIDKSCIMTIVNALMHIGVIPVFLIRSRLKTNSMVKVLFCFVLIIIVPLITTIYRVMQYKNYKNIVQLVILYYIYYYVRINVLYDKLIAKI